MQTIKITTSQNIDIDYQVAGLGDRIVARLIDYAIFIGIYFVCIIVFTIFIGINDYNSNGTNIGILIVIGVWLVMCVFYDLLCEIFMNGQSLGKRSMKIKVISLDGARPNVGQYLLRWIFRIIDVGVTAGSCGLICIAMSDKKQRVGDMVAGTTVVSLAPKTNFNDLVFSPPPDDYVPVYQEASILSDQDIVLIYDVIRNFNRTRNSGLVYKLAMQLKSYLKVTYTREINEYQFLEIILNDYKTLTARV
jgi:uncharacterized RDD family membrane protein YckC